MFFSTGPVKGFKNFFPFFEFLMYTDIFIDLKSIPLQIQISFFAVLLLK